jgi:hypothetical protein
MFLDIKMNKKESIKYIRKHNGYVPYISLFEIYNDDEEIPQELIDIECKEDKPSGSFIICSAKLAKQFKNICF